jgi:dCMP deaminase
MADVEPIMRPLLDAYMMELAKVAATRTTCIRRGVGCALMDSRGFLLGLGYNGVASSVPHCNEVHAIGGDYEHLPHVCVGHHLPPGQDSCEAVHAEQNAILQCGDPWKIDTTYVTLSPCKACLKLLLNTSCRRIVFLEEHTDLLPREMWLKAGRSWHLFKP